MRLGDGVARLTPRGFLLASSEALESPASTNFFFVFFGPAVSLSFPLAPGFSTIVVLFIDGFRTASLTTMPDCSCISLVSDASVL